MVSGNTTLFFVGIAAIGRSGDRVYTADQTSNTVSVIDPATNKVLGIIRLGEPVPIAVSPLYRGDLLVHGLGFSSARKTLAVVSIGSNSVTFIDTETNVIKGRVYVGRSPHEAFFRPDGRELWVAVRGENYVSIIDADQLREVRRIETANGPGMVIFRSDGNYAFVPSSFTPKLDVIDTATYKVVARIPQISPFSPNLAADQNEVWFTLKDLREDRGDLGKAAVSEAGCAEYRSDLESRYAHHELHRTICVRHYRRKRRGPGLSPGSHESADARRDGPDRRFAPWDLGFGRWHPRVRWIREWRFRAGYRRLDESSDCNDSGWAIAAGSRLCGRSDYIRRR